MFNEKKFKSWYHYRLVMSQSGSSRDTCIFQPVAHHTLKTLSEFEHEALARALDDILPRTNWAWQNAKNIVADK